MKDKLGRRKRHVPQSTGKRVTPQERDVLWFQKLLEHGPLPSSFLLAYAQGSHKSEKRAKERLTDLFNEKNTPDDGTYLSRPPLQFRTFNAGYNQLVYDVTKHSLKALDRTRIDSLAGNANAGPWLHRHMVACITASIELATLDRDDVSYISQQQILKRADTELRAETTITEPSGAYYTKNLLPDALFGLQYHISDGDRFRFFVVEADRSTEPATSRNFNRKSLLRTLLQYQDYIDNGLYREHLGLTSPLLVLNVVKDEKRLDQLLRLTSQEIGDGCSYQLFQAWDAFGEIFVPPQPNLELLEHAWQRAGNDPLVIG
ncbi:MAG: replication-relaxation family protein [Sphingorhabdus sp.]